MDEIKEISAKKERESAFFLLCMGIIFSLAIISCSANPETKDLKGTAAPDFHLTDLEGKPFHLKAERGKMVFIIFTTTWCSTCTYFIPAYKEIYKEYGKKENFVLVNIDIEEPHDRVRAFAQAYNIPYRILMDDDGKVRQAYGVMGVPSFVLVDAEGKILSMRSNEILAILRDTFDS